MEHLPRSIGERVRSVRKQLELNQVEFSQMLGISQGKLSAIESGKAKPSFEFLIQIPTIYKVNLNWLLLAQEAELPEEQVLLFSYRQLEKAAQDEVLDYIRLKLKRYRMFAD